MDSYLNYGKFIDFAMRNVVRSALKEVVEKGLTDGHHFYITFSTQHPAVSIPPELLKKYQDEITIVIQYQYWNLEVYEDKFNITLSFGGIKYNMEVPYAALISFADPSVSFGLQFNYHSDFGKSSPQSSKGGDVGNISESGAKLAKKAKKAKLGEIATKKTELDKQNSKKNDEENGKKPPTSGKELGKNNVVSIEQFLQNKD